MWNIKFYVFVYFYKSVTIDWYFVFKAHKPMSSPNSAFSLSLVSLSCTRPALAIGIIMAVVAVLLIHMERNHVGSIMPNINLKRKIDYFCIDGSMWDMLIYSFASHFRHFHPYENKSCWYRVALSVSRPVFYFEGLIWCGTHVLK